MCAVAAPLRSGHPVTTLHYPSLCCGCQAGIPDAGWVAGCVLLAGWLLIVGHGAYHIQCTPAEQWEYDHFVEAHREYRNRYDAGTHSLVVHEAGYHALRSILVYGSAAKVPHQFFTRIEMSDRGEGCIVDRSTWRLLFNPGWHPGGSEESCGEAGLPGLRELVLDGVLGAGRARVCFEELGAAPPDTSQERLHQWLDEKGAFNYRPPPPASVPTYTMLRSIRLSRNVLHVDDVECLADIVGHPQSTLHELSLQSNRINTTGARALATVLGKNTTLLDLDLAHNRFRDSGVAQLLAGLEGNRTLTRLSLRNNHLGAKAAKAIARVVKNHPGGLKELDLRDETLSIREQVVLIGTILRSLLEPSEKTPDWPSMLALTPLPAPILKLDTRRRVSQLELAHYLGEYTAHLVQQVVQDLEQGSQDLDFRRLRHCVCLLMQWVEAHQNSEQCPLQDHEVILDMFQALDAIREGGARAVRPKSGGTLSLQLAGEREGAMREMLLWCHHPGSAGVLSFVTDLPEDAGGGLRELRLCGCKLANALAVGTMLSAFTGLQTLNLEQNSLGGALLEAFDQIADSIAEHTSLSTLNLAHNGLKDTAAATLLTALRKNRSLTIFDLSHNHLGRFVPRWISIVHEWCEWIAGMMGISLPPLCPGCSRRTAPCESSTWPRTIFPLWIRPK